MIKTIMLSMSGLLGIGAAVVPGIYAEPLAIGYPSVPILVDGMLQRAPQGLVRVGNELYATVDQENAVGPWYLVKSADRGNTWDLVTQLNTTGNFPRLATNGVDRLYIMTRNGQFRRYDLAGTLLYGHDSVGGGNDPALVWVAPNTLVHAYTVGTAIKVRRSTDDGNVWSDEAHVADFAPAMPEDLRMVVAANGDVLLMAEREFAELGESEIVQFRSTTQGASWGGEQVIVPRDGTTDHEGGHYAVLSNGALVFVWPNNSAGGASYDHNQIYQIVSCDHGMSYSAPRLVLDQPSHVAFHAVANHDDTITILSRRYHNSSEMAHLAGAYSHILPAVHAWDLNATGIAVIVAGVPLCHCAQPAS